MRDKFIEYFIKNIKKKNELSKKDELACRYALYAIYAFITKMGAVLIISIVLNLFIETLLLLLLYGLLRFFGAGMHAASNLYCWISTIATYIILPLLIKYTILNTTTYFIILAVASILVIMFSPADTEKKPILRKEVRIRNQMIISVIVLIFIAISIIFNNTILDNTILYSLIMQAIIVNPISYKIFGMRYNNYLHYQPKKV